MSRHYDISLAEVENAWKSVRKAGGGAGYDAIEIEDFAEDLENNLYKVWNRMTSGSYMSQPVLNVKIPKSKGGYRLLGIPTVQERVAQMVIKNRLQPVLEEVFHRDSYAYRPNKSAIDAVTTCRSRCFKHTWIIEVDIQGFFDEVDHQIMMDLLQKYTQDKSILLYSRRFLTATAILENGKHQARTKGTPQGGVASPLFANLYLHEAFDSWMQEKFPALKFERYADDIVVHCVSEKQAHFIKNQIERRLEQFKLKMHPEKTRVVYTGTDNKPDKRGLKLSRKFTFLGYDFKPRRYKSGVVFTPSIGTGALKMIRQKIKKKWKLRSKLHNSFEQLANEVNKTTRGWINYYGHHRRSELYKLQSIIDMKLVRFLRDKHKSIKTWMQARESLRSYQKERPKLFVHWYMISQTT